MGSVTLSYQSSFPLDSTDAQMQSASVYESLISEIICIALYQCVARLYLSAESVCGRASEQVVFAEIEL